MNNYSDFDNLCSKKKFKDINILVIPGNHDSDFSSKMIKSGNVQVISGSPQIVEFGKISFLFAPYHNEKTMGEAIAPFKEKLKDKEWVMIGHGDWLQQPEP